MMQRHGRAANFIDQFLAARLNFIQVRRTKWLVSRFRKNQISHFEIAHWAVVRSRQRVNLLRDPQRGLADPVIWPDVAHDRRINCVCENDQSIISHFGSVLSVRESSRQNDIGIGGPNQKTELFQRGDLVPQLRQRGAELPFSLRRRRLEPVLSFDFLQTILGRGEIRIRRSALFRPAITGEWFEIRCHTSSNWHPVRVGTICIDVHVRLEQERFAVTLRVLQLQDGLAIEKIVP